MWVKQNKDGTESFTKKYSKNIACIIYKMKTKTNRDAYYVQYVDIEILILTSKKGHYNINIAMNKADKAYKKYKKAYSKERKEAFKASLQYANLIKKAINA